MPEDARKSATGCGRSWPGLVRRRQGAHDPTDPREDQDAMTKTEKRNRKSDAPSSGRRKFLGVAGLAAGAGVATLAMPNVSRAQTVTLKMQGSWGASDVFNEFAQDYVSRVNAMAGNRLKIDYLVGGAVVHPFSVQDAVHSGVLDG